MEPSSVSARVCVSSLGLGFTTTNFARPKSSTLMPDFVVRILAGLRSRWVIDLRCAAFQRPGKLNGNLEREVEREWALYFRAFDVLHDDVVGTDVVNLADIRMIQSGDGAGLALKSFAELFEGRFDGDDTVQARVASFPYFTHATGTDGREDFVRAEFVASGK